MFINRLALQAVEVAERACTVHILCLLQTRSRGYADVSNAYATSETGLPVAERCKAILAGNWRGQVTTVPIEEGRGNEEGSKTHSTICSYVSPRSTEPVVVLDKQRDIKQIKNLAMNPLGSLTVGATDPPALVQLAQLSGRMPERVSLLGKLDQLPRSEVEHVLRQSHPAADAPAADAVLVYQMQTMEIRYVDTQGSRHALGIGDVLGAVLDPLAVDQVELLQAGLNDGALQQSLALFCMAHLHAPVGRAALFQADRRGLTILGKQIPLKPEWNLPAGVPEAARQPGWHEYRLEFLREVRSREAFDRQLAEMRRELDEALVEG